MSRSRPAARSRICRDGWISGLGGWRMASLSGPVQAGKARPRSSKSGSSAGDPQALPFSQPVGEGAMLGGQVLDPRAELRDVRPGGQGKSGALFLGGGLGFAGAQWRELLAGVTVAQFGVGSDVRQPDPARRRQTKPWCMICRRSGLRSPGSTPYEGSPHAQFTDRHGGLGRGEPARLAALLPDADHGS